MSNTVLEGNLEDYVNAAGEVVTDISVANNPEVIDIIIGSISHNAWMRQQVPYNTTSPLSMHMRGSSLRNIEITDRGNVAIISETSPEDRNKAVTSITRETRNGIVILAIIGPHDESQPTETYTVQYLKRNIQTDDGRPAAVSFMYNTATQTWETEGLGLGGMAYSRGRAEGIAAPQMLDEAIQVFFDQAEQATDTKTYSNNRRQLS